MSDDIPFGYFVRISPVLFLALVGASPPFIALGWHVWEKIQPLLIPQEDIDSFAEDMIARFGMGAMCEAQTLAQRAQIRGETAEHGCLLRVMRAIESRDVSDVQVH